MSKYSILKNILGAICQEAPKELDRYQLEDGSIEKINKANSLAYIHLLLKSKFNIINFDDREKFITDGSYDGGIDAYYIDHDKREIFFIQSKFRTNENNFENKYIELSEINKMEIDRITGGNKTSENGQNYNGKIQSLIRKIQDIEQISRYDFRVIILANVDKELNKAMSSLINLPFEIYDYNRSYDELVFPVVSGTVHQATDISVNLSLGAKNNYTMDYLVEEGEYSTSVQLYFVPIIEIAKLMSNHKNSILKYNPRSYLGASNNEVNSSIKNSVVERNDNVFALFNNGITMLSDSTSFTSRTGRTGEGELSLLNPQIINGGQTAYTLASIYEDENIDNSYMNNKEVLVKVITFDQDMKDEEKKLELIKDLSLTTNNQSEVTVADRKSNSDVQLELQKYLYMKYGYFYHRKKGEFGEGLDKGYIEKEQIIERDTIIRIIYAMNGLPSIARRNSEDSLYKQKRYEEFFNTSLGDKGYDKIFYLYKVYVYLHTLKDDNSYGYALRYGKYAVISVVSKILGNNVIKLEFDEVYDIAKSVLAKWKEFENVQRLKPSNSQYFYENTIISPSIKESYEENGSNNIEESITYVMVEDFDNYYKGSTVNNDLNTYNFIVSDV